MIGHNGSFPVDAVGLEHLGALRRSEDDRALDAALLAAHASNDARQLIDLYAEAADRAETRRDVDATAFYLTHAYVFALEAGDPAADTLHSRLLAYGREE